MINQNRYCIVIIARNQLEEVKGTIDSIKKFSDLNENGIIVVDNGSEDGTRNWLEEQQEIDYVICDEGLENYAHILNEIVQEFISDEDLLILTAGMIVLPNCIEILREALYYAKEVGAVVAKKCVADEAVKCITGQLEEWGKKEILGLPPEAVMIRNEMLLQIGEFDASLILPKSIMVDFAFRGLEKGYRYFEIQNAFICKILNDEDVYVNIYGRNVDRAVLQEKWGMNYFNQRPNYGLLALIEKAKEEEFNVLEIGCDCGVNLLHLKNEFSKVNLYGVEINQSAALVAAYVAQVQVANIEEKMLDFDGIKFDYIIFGDVLEHLRNPEEVLVYCKSLLKDEGRILACIPNLMHYTVMAGLLNGNFQYSDTGLLDKSHIHFFTYNEIMKMFGRAGYEIKDLSYTGGIHTATEQDKELVNKLLTFSDNTKEFMYYAFQYIVSAKKV